MNIDKEREAFEKWADREGFDLIVLKHSFIPNTYFNSKTKQAWDAWQARAALLPSVEQICQILESDPNDMAPSTAYLMAVKINELMEPTK